MKMWGKLGIGVIGIVSVPGDTEAHVRRRIRTAAKYRDVIFELEVESNSVFPEHSHGKIFHYQLDSLPITTSNTARSFAVGSDKVLRCWLTDLNVRQESNAASSPFWPVLGDYGLIERKRNALTPSAGFFAIKRLNSLARSIPTAPSRAPEFYTNSPAGLFTRAWVTPEGRTIIASWWPYGQDVRYKKLEIETSQPVRWQFIEPSRTSAYSPIMHGQAWSGNITNHPLLLLVDPY
ncbi:hypothetical protein [Microbacterium sp. YY-01]|uniref:hypothetical protein n=1 Tax=Microbacterium sp. YY-01 TaxID=3421634 RepID=UPI003D16995F